MNSDLLQYSTSHDTPWNLISGHALLVMVTVATFGTCHWHELSKWFKTYWPFTRICSFCSVLTSHRNGLVLTTERRKPLCIITLVCWQAVPRAKHLHTSMKPSRSRARVLAHLHPFLHCPKMVRSSSQQYEIPDSSNTKCPGEIVGLRSVKNYLEMSYMERIRCLWVNCYRERFL